MSEAAYPPIRTFRPRRRRLSPSRAAAYEAAASRYVLDVDGPLLDWHAVFGRQMPVVLDIGFGFGEALIAMAAEQPDIAIVGVDVHTPGVAHVVAAAAAANLDNVRVVHGDALDFLPRVANLHGVRIFFPDPWIKPRQQIRRIVRPDVITALVDRLEPDGFVHLATDIADYAQRMAQVCRDEVRIRGGVIDRPAWRPMTRFELKGLAAGRLVTDLMYARFDSAADTL